LAVALRRAKDPAKHPNRWAVCGRRITEPRPKEVMESLIPEDVNAMNDKGESL